jgi:hypothetical protein
MEYFIGSIVTIVLLGALAFFTRRLPMDDSISIQTSQSYLFSLIGKTLLLESLNRQQNSQSKAHSKKIYVKILIVRNKAYWIKDNVFYVANVVDNDVDKSSAKEVDIMAMDKVQLEEAMFIIDKLKEDSYDSRDSGK